MYLIDYINRIKSFYPGLKIASGGKEILVRCPFCGDSDNKRHAHLYISVPQNDQEISLYQCKRCLAHGMVDDSFLRKIGCNDTNLLIDITKRNSEILSMPKYKSLKTIDVYPLRWNLMRNSTNNITKLNYIKSRLGRELTLRDIIENKIFFNLYDIINANRLELTRNEYICDKLDKYFIGFISYDNSYCGLRKITDKNLDASINKRYINYSLVNKIDDRKNFYVIPSTIDVMDQTPVNIHIAEGQFDILSIFYLNNANRKQNVYIACGGKSYSQALQFILMETMVINYNIHFYPDKDVTDNELRYIVLDKIANLPTNIFIHRNIFEGEKDYGVPPSRIKEVVKRY